MDKATLKTWIIIVAISGSSLSLVFFKYLQIVKTQHVNAIISQTTAHYQKLFTAKISTLLHELEFAQNFLQSSKYIDSTGFQQLSRPKKETTSALIALEWIPRISEEDLEQHQSNTRLHGNSDYLVKELTLRGKFTPVRNRTHYYPILYAEPIAFNKNVLGYDIGSDPELLSALKRAISTTTGTSTATLTLMQNNLRQDGFVILLPVYNPNSSTNRTELGALNLRGFIAGVFSVPGLIKDSLGFIKSPSTIIRFIDITEPRSHSASNINISETAHNKSRSVEIRIMDRDWKLEINFAESQFTDNTLMHLSILVLLSGLVITALIVYLAYQMYAKTIKVNDSLYEKTSDLQIIEQLQRIVFSKVSNAILLVSDKGFIQSINPATAKIFGYNERELVGNNIDLLVAKEHQKKHDKYIDHYQRTGKSRVIGQQTQLFGHHKMGHKIPLKIDVTEIHIRSQTFYSVVACDLSIETKTQEHDRRIIEAARLSTDIIISFDLERKLVYSNNTAQQLFNEDNNTVEKLIPNAAENFFRKAVMQPNVRHSWSGENTLTDNKGRITSLSLHILSHTCRIHEKLYFSAIIRDITNNEHHQDFFPQQRWG